jgi:phage terminase large subunit-like protein
MTTNLKQVPRGATEPRLHSEWLKAKTRGDEVVAFAKQIGRELMPWQEVIVRDYFSIDDESKFIRRTGLLLVARQNGKSELARIMCLAHLFLFGSRRVLIMSSNRSMTLVSFREIAYLIDSNAFLKEQVRAIRYANGSECIELKNHARLDIVAATRDGSRGRTADFLWIDELREIDEEAFTAATPTTRATDGQSFYTSNAGDAWSLVLNNLREKCLSYPPKSLGFYEYSAPQYCKINDRKAWAMANPALGYTVSEEALEEAMSTSSIESWRTESLMQWIDSLQSPWPHGAFEDCSDATLEMSPGPLTIFGFDVAPNRRTASLVAGQLLPDGRIGLGILQSWHSDVAVDEQKIAVEIKLWADKYFPRMICFDKYTTATIAQRLQMSGAATVDCSGTIFYQACSDFLDALVNKRLVHSGQEALIAQMNNCAAKQNDSAWRIIRRRSAGDVTAPISLAMVIHQLIKPQGEAKVFAI